jgi:hypothetical protein
MLKMFFIVLCWVAFIITVVILFCFIEKLIEERCIIIF